jgi:hypothetical protein
VSVELAPDKVINTYGYNGTVPGPVLRLKESRQVSINIVNDTDIDDIIPAPARNWRRPSDGITVEPAWEGMSRSSWSSACSNRDEIRVSKPFRVIEDGNHLWKRLWVR